MPAETIARATTAHGEVALRRRGDAVELIVDGVFAMDSVEVSSERALADAAGPAARALVGGLGLGYTAARLLDNGVGHVDVVERSAPLVEWARAGVTDQLGRLASDPRVTLHVGDIGAWLGSDDRWDAVLLDVDNGPGFLIHADNARLYAAEALAGFRRLLAPGGVLLVWCESPSPGLWAELRRLDAAASETIVDVHREGRRFDYALYAAHAG